MNFCHYRTEQLNNSVTYLGICQSAQLAMLSSPATRTPQPLKNPSVVTILHVPVKKIIRISHGGRPTNIGKRYCAEKYTDS